MNSFIAVDLDGTLVDNREMTAKFFPKDGKMDLDGFYKSIRSAPVYRPMMTVLTSLLLSSQLPWEVWTARQEQRGREPTEGWLRDHGLQPRAVRMNVQGDNWVSAPDVKEKFLADFGTPRMVFDDDEATIQMYLRYSVPVFKVTIP